MENSPELPESKSSFWNSKFIRFFDFIFDYLSLHFTIILVCLLPLIVWWAGGGQIKEIVTILMDDIANRSGWFKVLFFGGTVYFFGYFLHYVTLHGGVIIELSKKKKVNSTVEDNRFFLRAGNMQPIFIVLFFLGAVLLLRKSLNWISYFLIFILFLSTAFTILYYYLNLRNRTRDFWKYIVTTNGNMKTAKHSYFYNQMSWYILYFIILFLLFYFVFDNFILLFTAALGIIWVLLAILSVKKYIKKKTYEHTVSGLMIILAGLPIIYASLPTMFIMLGSVFITMVIFKIEKIALENNLKGYFFLLLAVVIAALLRGLIASIDLWTAGNTIETIALKQDVKPRESIVENYHNWLAKKKKNSGVIRDTNLVYILTTEGGGIRSAIWTNGFLTKLDSLLPNVVEKTYAISSVSGGSVGSAIFCALKKDGLDSLQYRNQQIFSGDILSNTILSTLIGYPVQLITPAPIKAIDRSRVLEKDLARIYKSVTQQSTLEQGLLSLYETNDYSIPNLFLNTTQVESGKNCIISNVKLDSHFSNDLDLLDAIDADIPLNTSAVMSARFPIVSSSGLVFTPDGEKWGNLVDGGFYDNSGLLTTIDIVKMMRMNTPDSLYIKPVIIFLQNGNSAPQKKGSKGFAPVNSMLNSWSANTERRIKDLEEIQSLFDYELIQFQLDHSTKRDGLSYPLGWLYSNQTVDDLVQAVSEVGVSNSTTIEITNQESWNKLKSLEQEYQ